MADRASRCAPSLKASPHISTGRDGFEPAGDRLQAGPVRVATRRSHQTRAMSEPLDPPAIPPRSSRTPRPRAADLLTRRRQGPCQGPGRWTARRLGPYRASVPAGSARRRREVVPALPQDHDLPSEEDEPPNADSAPGCTPWRHRHREFALHPQAGPPQIRATRPQSLVRGRARSPMAPIREPGIAVPLLDVVLDDGVAHASSGGPGGWSTAVCQQP